MSQYEHHQRHVAPRQSAAKRVLTSLASFFGFLLSHLGLLALVVGYCLAGAALFEAVEGPHERALKHAMPYVRENVTAKLWARMVRSNVLREEEWKAEVERELLAFEKELLIAMKEKGWDGVEGGEPVSWTFTGESQGSQLIDSSEGFD